MADFTPQQLQAMQALIAGTFDKLDTTPKIQPGYSLSDIYGGMYPASGSSVASTFPARPEVPFSNTSRDRLQPNANPNIPGAGVAANDWFSQPGSYVNQMGTVKVSDLPALKKPPLDITVRGGNTTNTLLAMMGGTRPGAAKMPKIDTPFPGAAVRYKTAIGPQMGMVGGKQPVTNVAASMKPGYQRGNGLSGLLASLFTQPATAVGSQLDTQPSRSDRYTLDTLPAFSGPRSGVATNGYVYQNGQNIGTTRPAGVGPAQYDAMINAAAKARAQANATSGYTQSENSWFNEVTGR